VLQSRGAGAVVIIDCRHDLANPAFGEKAYAAGHLPGAFFLHLDRDLSGPLTGTNGRHPLPDAQSLGHKLGEIGVGEDTQVVAYDDAGGMFAARLWWLMRWLGHRAVAVLDGGLQAWGRAGGALTTARPVSAPCVFPIKPGEPWVEASGIEANLISGGALLIDARSPDRFAGENETLDPVAGHIPGARNRFFRQNLERDGTFKPSAVLRAEFLAVLQDRHAAEVIHQCGSGVTACHNLLAMEVAGLGGSRLYPGSWSEWCANPARPVARGA
jgi:thiosulfate/3-mercaptopyruvate sulfurtransferase